SIDWTDSDLLREIVRRRLVFSGAPGDRPFDEAWRRVCVSHVHGEESAQYLIERSLMRPRSLLDLVNQCRSCAVNLRHTRIGPDDIEKGVSQYSTDLVRDISLEIRDVLPAGENTLYAFIDVPSKLGMDEVVRLLQQLGLSETDRERLIDILLWYGVLGLVR